MTNDPCSPVRIDRTSLMATRVVSITRAFKPQPRRFSDEMLAVLVGVALLTSAAGSIVAGASDLDGKTDPSAIPQLAWANRFSLVFCAGAVILLASKRVRQPRLQRILKTPTKWILLYQCIIATHLFIDGNLWDAGRLCGGWLILALAMCLSPSMIYEVYLARITTIFRVLLCAAMVTALLLPAAGLDVKYTDGFLPGITSRLSGDCGDPNAMGAVAGFALLLELYRLRRDRCWFSAGTLFLVLAGAELLLTQSKTAIVACGIGMAWLWGQQGSRRSLAAIRTASVFVIAVAVSAGVSILLEQWIGSHTEGLSTLTGRTGLWRVYWELAWDAPIFGHGPGLWTDLRSDYSFQYKFAAGNAHNQLLNSFLMAGLVGVGIWVWYVASLFRSGKRIAVRVRPLYSSLLLFLLIRCVSEFGLEPGQLWITGHLQTVLLGFVLCRKTPRYRNS